MLEKVPCRRPQHSKRHRDTALTRLQPCINPTFLEQIMQFEYDRVNGAPSKLFSCRGFAVSEVKEGRSVGSCCWVITRGTTPGHSSVCVNEGSLVQCRTRQGFPNFVSWSWTATDLHPHCLKSFLGKIYNSFSCIFFSGSKVKFQFVSKIPLTAFETLLNWWRDSVCCVTSLQ